MSNDNSFELEWQNTIQTLSNKNSKLKELKYFLNLGSKYSKICSEVGNKSKLILVGTTFPEEIVRALGIEYYYVLGGSFESTLLDNVNLPKDADDCARSIVGILKSENLKLSKDDVLLVPLYNDSMKKLKAQFSDVANVICYEVPSDKNDPLLQNRFAYEIERVTAELKKHFKKKLSSRKLQEQIVNSKKATDAFSEFEKVFSEKKSALSDSAFLYIASSYMWCQDKAEWASHLSKLTSEISKIDTTEVVEYPEVLFFGSPIYAPDYKVLFVLEEMQLRINTIIHPDIEHIRIAGRMDTKSASIKGLASAYLEADISPAFINNDTMIDLVMKALKDNKIRGIIAHILKGQIEYDYEFKNIEKLIVDYKVPMNRIETVYNYQDIEQLRLRLEAFSEMLNMG